MGDASDLEMRTTLGIVLRENFRKDYSTRTKWIEIKDILFLDHRIQQYNEGSVLQILTCVLEEMFGKKTKAGFPVSKMEGVGSKEKIQDALDNFVSNHVVVVKNIKNGVTMKELTELLVKTNLAFERLQRDVRTIGAMLKGSILSILGISKPKEGKIWPVTLKSKFTNRPITRQSFKSMLEAAIRNSLLPPEQQRTYHSDGYSISRPFEKPAPTVNLPSCLSRYDCFSFCFL